MPLFTAARKRFTGMTFVMPLASSSKTLKAFKAYAGDLKASCKTPISLTD
jgi:hypothetical protein